METTPETPVIIIVVPHPSLIVAGKNCTHRQIGSGSQQPRQYEIFIFVTLVPILLRHAFLEGFGLGESLVFGHLPFLLGGIAGMSLRASPG
jgi:hypothetical protein